MCVRAELNFIKYSFCPGHMGQGPKVKACASMLVYTSFPLL